MAVKKRSIALEADVADAIVKEAKAQGVSFSAWLSAAARKQLKLEQGRRASREALAELGIEMTDADRERADDILRKHGLIPKKRGKRRRGGG